jgi:hypothetical protein
LSQTKHKTTEAQTETLVAGSGVVTEMPAASEPLFPCTVLRLGGGLVLRSSATGREAAGAAEDGPLGPNGPAGAATRRQAMDQSRHMARSSGARRLLRALFFLFFWLRKKPFEQVD